MSLKQTIYFMALVGGLAGLICWAIVVWITWRPDLVQATVLGMLIGGLTVCFADHWSAGEIVPRWIASGMVIGFVAGLVSGFVQGWLGTLLLDQKRVAVVASWMVTGALIGLGTGLRWMTVNKLRILHALGGGMFGGILGGLVFASSTLIAPRNGFSWLPDLSEALALMITGIGITCGVTLAPVLLRDGVLRFISSGDARAHNKYGPKHMEWELHDGDSQIVGRSGGDGVTTIFGRAVAIEIADQLVNSKHAIISGRKGHFYIELHPENRGPQGQPLSPLQVRGEDVIMPQQLRHGDDVIVGQTLLRFETRKKAATS